MIHLIGHLVMIVGLMLTIAIMPTRDWIYVGAATSLGVGHLVLAFVSNRTSLVVGSLVQQKAIALFAAMFFLLAAVGLAAMALLGIPS